MIVTVDAQQLPVAAVGRIVVVVMVLVMDRQFFQFLAGEFASATPTDMREQRERPLPITLLSNLQVPSKLRQDLGLLFSVGR